MDIHKPKPIHGWRDFLKEIGTIVIGVMIALAAEQMVEWWHWQSELRETRQALQAELSHAIGAYQYNLTLQGCANRRLDELTQWLDHSQPGERPPAVRPIGSPPRYTLLLGAWDVAKGGQAAWRMPLKERLLYAHLYGTLSRIYNVQLDDNAIWQQLAQFTAAEPLDHADRMKLRGLVAQARTSALIARGFGPFIMPDVNALAITAERRSAINADMVQTFCQPLFAH